MISVVIPLYNKERKIANTISTVFAQTYTDYEIVIVDDGSTDSSAEIVAAMHDERIRLIRQENAGVSAARNRGIAEARGEFIALLDADDEWKPDYLATQMQLVIDYPQCDVFATNYEFRNERGEVSPTIIRRLPFTSTSGVLSNYFEVAAVSHPPIWTSAVMARKSAFEAVGGFPVGIKSGEDLLTWARLACRYKIAFDTTVNAAFIFDEQHFNDDQKARHPELIDYVGSSLKQLYAANKSITGLKSYIGLWHKMRCRIFISKRCRLNAIKESFIAVRYNRNLKYFVFLVLSLLPFNVSNKIIKSFS
jgi:glycosyltransferase involved in cell wall biosynthesis